MKDTELSRLLFPPLHLTLSVFNQELQLTTDLQTTMWFFCRTLRDKKEKVSFLLNRDKCRAVLKETLSRKYSVKGTNHSPDVCSEILMRCSNLMDGAQML